MPDKVFMLLRYTGVDWENVNVTRTLPEALDKAFERHRKNTFDDYRIEEWMVNGGDVPIHTTEQDWSRPERFTYKGFLKSFTETPVYGEDDSE